MYFLLAVFVEWYFSSFSRLKSVFHFAKKVYHSRFSIKFIFIIYVTRNVIAQKSTGWRAYLFKMGIEHCAGLKFQIILEGTIQIQIFFFKFSAYSSEIFRVYSFFPGKKRQFLAFFWVFNSITAKKLFFFGGKFEHFQMNGGAKPLFGMTWNLECIFKILLATKTFNTHLFPEL